VEPTLPARICCSAASGRYMPGSVLCRSSTYRSTCVCREFIRGPLFGYGSRQRVGAYICRMGQAPTSSHVWSPDEKQHKWTRGHQDAPPNSPSVSCRQTASSCTQKGSGQLSSSNLTLGFLTLSSCGLLPRYTHPHRSYVFTSYVFTCLNMGLGMPCRPLRTNCVSRPHTYGTPPRGLSRSFGACRKRIIPYHHFEGCPAPAVSLGHASNAGQRTHAVLSIAHHTLASFREMPCVSGTCWATGTCACACGCCDDAAVSTPVAPPVEAGAGKLPSIS
jgi:hypothetical protein